MRKVVYIIILVMATYLVSGCGKESNINSNDNELIEILSCNYEENGATSEYIQTFKNKVYQDDAKVKFTLDFSEYTDDEIEQLETQDFCTTFMTNLFSSGQNSCIQNIENKKLIVEASVNIYKSASDNIDSERTYELVLEDTKEYLENSGYSCTVK